MLVARACVFACLAAFPCVKYVIATRLVHKEQPSGNATEDYERNPFGHGSGSASEEEGHDSDKSSDSEGDAQVFEFVARFLEEANSDLRIANSNLLGLVEAKLAEYLSQFLEEANSELMSVNAVLRDQLKAELAEKLAQVVTEANAELRKRMSVLREGPVIRVDHFAEALKAFDRRFRLEADLGYYTWHRACPARGPNSPRACPGDVRVEELRCGLDARGRDLRYWQVPESRPLQLVDIDRIRDRLPLEFPFKHRSSMPFGFRSGLPHEPPPVASLFLASFDLSQVDFFIGGSVLYSLATGDFSNKQFTVQQWRGITLIQSHKHYFVDLTGKGFQFERLLTGRAMHSLDSSALHFEHLCVLRIADFTVLVSAEVDAVDDRHRPVEVTTAFQPKWERIMFQLMSLASVRLLLGRVNYDTLNGIDEYGLREIVGSIPAYQLYRFADTIVRALLTIRNRVNDGSEQLFDLSGSDLAGVPQLIPLSLGSMRSQLPDRDVLVALFGSG